MDLSKWYTLEGDLFVMDIVGLHYTELTYQFVWDREQVSIIIQRFECSH